MMRLLAMTAAVCGLMTSAAFAQGAPAQDGPQNAIVKSTHDNNASQPVSGANSFTMEQTKSQIEARGYTRVSGLKLDTHGVWRGTATKDGHTGPVTVDYQGNVN